MNNWVHEAVQKIEAEYHRSADTHLFKLPLAKLEDVHIYLKDESTHPTGSLKHRLARSLFLYALCNGKLNADTTVVEASSGNTAISEAYFAQLIGLPFVAVMPKNTAKRKVRQVEHYGGRVHLVDSSQEMHAAAVELADSVRGYFMDQFTYAERATDWRGNNNIAESLFRQMEQEACAVPSAIVMSAGTGGTSATLGRYIRYKGYDTRLVVVDPENSVYFEAYKRHDSGITSAVSSRIEGIGRPRVEHSFITEVIDDMLQVPDAASIATMLLLEQLIDRRTGASTGTNLWGALKIAGDMQRKSEKGSIVTLICDGGERYQDSYYNPDWVQNNVGDIDAYTKLLSRWL